VRWAVGMCGPEEIDELNILRASMLAMLRAAAGLSIKPEFILVDGNRLPEGISPAAGKAIVKGDAKSASIAAASIIAKETRDRIMKNLAERFPAYGWDKNAGYPTRAHLQAMEKHGINEHYRKTFSPVLKLVRQNNDKGTENATQNNI
jgi:ribonuclease HII